jgi:hypothetical protein
MLQSDWLDRILPGLGYGEIARAAAPCTGLVSHTSSLHLAEK